MTEVFTCRSESERIYRIRSKLKINFENFATDEYYGVVLHSNSIIVELNQAAAAMFGYQREEVLGLNAWLLFPPESVETLMQNLITQSNIPYRVMAKHRDQSLFEIELKGKDFEIAGEPVRLVLMKTVGD